MSELAAVLNAFHPAHEVIEPRFFAGRARQVQEIAEALQVHGSCPLIYGDRGLGKSSLAVQAQLIAMGDAELLAAMNARTHVLPESATFMAFYITCSERISSIEHLIQSMINAVEDLHFEEVEEAGRLSRPVDRTSRRKVAFKLFEYETVQKFEQEKERSSYARLSSAEQLLEVVRLVNATYSSPVLFVIDELDRVQDKSGLASFIKATSSHDLKYILVGIAQSISELLEDHDSLARILYPIHLPRMSNGELADIVDRAVAALNELGYKYSFDNGARQELVRTAGGFPWFVHVLGQAALRDALSEGRHKVDRDALIRARRSIITNSFAQQFADKYQRAVRDSHPREALLRALAEWKGGSDIPTVEVYRLLREKFGVSNPSVYKGHLMQEHYGSVLINPPYQQQGLVRFQSEMFRQYVRMRPSLYVDLDSQVRESM